MKKAFLFLAAVLMTISASAFDLKDVLGGLSGQGGQTEGKGGDILSGIGAVVGSLTSSSNFDLNSLVGTWDYSSPAVTFASDNFFQKAGGAAAASQVEKKLEKYYKMVGFNKMVLTVNKDMTYTMKLKMATAMGTISRDEKTGLLVFTFEVAGRQLGAVSASAEKSLGNTISLTFDASKFIDIINKMASVTQNKTLSAASQLLNTYDGLYMGAKFKKK